MRRQISFFIVINFILLLSSCGKEKPVETTASLVKAEYFDKKLRSECAVIDSAAFRNVPQKASVPFGKSFTEEHALYPSPADREATGTSGRLNGRLVRKIYHDEECKDVAFTILLTGSNFYYQTTDSGLEIEVPSMGLISAHDEQACQYLAEQFDWSNGRRPGGRKFCQVDSNYDLGSDLFQPDPRERHKVFEKVARLRYEILLASVTPKQLKVKGPADFFVLITNVAGDLEFGPSKPIDPAYKLIPNNNP